MPEISRFFGIVITMHYNEHPPPHFYVRYSGQKATIPIPSLTLLNGSLSPSVFGMAMERAALHQVELMDNWELARQQAPLQRIAPLQ